MRCTGRRAQAAALIRYPIPAKWSGHSIPSHHIDIPTLTALTCLVKERFDRLIKQFSWPSSPFHDVTGIQISTPDSFSQSHLQWNFTSNFNRSQSSLNCDWFCSLAGVGLVILLGPSAVCRWAEIINNHRTKLFLGRVVRYLENVSFHWTLRHTNQYTIMIHKSRAMYRITTGFSGAAIIVATFHPTSEGPGHNRKTLFPWTTLALIVWTKTVLKISPFVVRK